MQSANQRSYLQDNSDAPLCGGKTNKSPQKPFVIIVDDQSTGRKILEKLVLGITPEPLVESFTDPRKALERIHDQTPSDGRTTSLTVCPLRAGGRRRRSRVICMRLGKSG